MYAISFVLKRVERDLFSKNDLGHIGYHGLGILMINVTIVNYELSIIIYKNLTTNCNKIQLYIFKELNNSPTIHSNCMHTCIALLLDHTQANALMLTYS